MANSKLSTLVIDCQTQDLDSAMTFWSQALHLEASPNSHSEGRYRTLRGGHVGVLLQRVEWPSSYHMDIEADDVDAEADRLEALGATRKRKIQSWWVMRAPTGHDFCVVPRPA
jgi:predicted enzyme related to lactoylglutathione lyase